MPLEREMMAFYFFIKRSLNDTSQLKIVAVCPEYDKAINKSPS